MVGVSFPGSLTSHWQWGLETGFLSRHEFGESDILLVPLLGFLNYRVAPSARVTPWIGGALGVVVGSYIVPLPLLQIGVDWQFLADINLLVEIKFAPFVAFFSNGSVPIFPQIAMGFNL